MNTIIETKAYKCSNCNNAYMTKQAAEKCCTPKICEDCGTEMPPKYYYVACKSCREKRKYDHAEKVNLVDYINSDPYLPVFTKEGKMICHDELWCLDSENDWREYFGDDETELPEYVYGAKRQFVQLNADSIISNLNDEVAFEDDFEMFNDEACARIKKFCDEWNERHRFEYFEEDTKIALLT